MYFKLIRNAEELLEAVGQLETILLTNQNQSEYTGAIIWSKGTVTHTQTKIGQCSSPVDFNIVRAKGGKKALGAGGEADLHPGLSWSLLLVNSDRQHHNQ